MLHVVRTCQQSESHCGPATLQMLLQHQGVSFSQDDITAAAGVSEVILEKGTRPHQLAQAVARLAPHFQFWFKQNASVTDLHRLIHDYRLPSIVNWQGLFYDTLEEEVADFPGANIEGDHGHYSVCIGIETSRDEIRLADPYPDFYSAPRLFSLRWFETRWWDYARDEDLVTGETVTIRPHHLMFIITPKDSAIPAELGFCPPGQLPQLRTA